MTLPLAQPAHLRLAVRRSPSGESGPGESACAPTPSPAARRLLDARVVLLHLALENGERDGAVFEHDVVEGFDVETIPEALSSFVAQAQDLDLAIKLLTAIIELKPDYVEAWNRRATIYYMKREFGASLADIRQVLAREPRHFGAISGLGMILQEFGDEKSALAVFRRALAIHPRLPKIPELVKQLSEKVEGRDI